MPVYTPFLKTEISFSEIKQESASCLLYQGDNKI